MLGLALLVSPRFAMTHVVEGLEVALHEAIDRGDVIVRDPSYAPPRDPSNHS